MQTSTRYINRDDPHAGRKGVSFQEPSLTESPPLTSSLHSRNSAPSREESAYLRKAVIQRWARLIATFLVIALGLAVVGCLSHILRIYNASHLRHEWQLTFWPVNLDLKPTLAILCSAAILVCVSLCYLIFAVIPSPRAHFTSQNVIFTLATGLGLILSLFAIIYTFVIRSNSSTNGRETLETFTCRLYEGAATLASDAEKVNLNIDASALMPEGFKRLCAESRVANWLMVSLFCLELVCVGIAAVGLASEKNINKIRRSRYPMDKSMFA